jgi:hypothetical protein
MGNDNPVIEEIRAALAPHGIFVRGIVTFAGDGPALEDGGPAASVILLGNVGGSIWPAFSDWRRRHPDLADPLDAWSAACIRPVAEKVDGTAFFPSEKPWQPFQQWAMRAEGLKPSPLGILIHPDYGLWHGYRGAIGIPHPAGGPGSSGQRPHPCDHCIDKPCLPHCPAGAVRSDRFEVAACRSHLAQAGRDTCMVEGCLARNACPVGTEYRYPGGQLRFHMDALSLP